MTSLFLRVEQPLLPSSEKMSSLGMEKPNRKSLSKDKESTYLGFTMSCGLTRL